MSVDLKLPKIERSGIALDIDETLSFTIRYWVTEMQKLFGNPEDLSVEDMIAKYRYTQNVPYWQSPEALSWAEHHRNSNDIQTKLPLIPYADIYVNKLHKIVPIVAYISIRPDTVLVGTKQWLLNYPDTYPFPKAPIICRPKDIPVEQGTEWKARVLEELYPKVRGIIDDNQSILNFLKKDYHGVIFLFNHTKVINSPIKNIPCKDWPATYELVKKYFSNLPSTI